MTATLSKPAKASTYTVKMELRDGKPVFSIPKKHRESFEQAAIRAEQYAGLGMNGLSAEAKEAQEAIHKLLAVLK